MKILSVTINNFLTIGQAELSLDNKGLVLVQGSNLDDASAVSNGAGKSSIPDAICWALYGTTARGVTGDDIINTVAKKDCFVSVNVEDGDDLFIIARHRKHSAFKNTSVVTRVHKPSGATSDLSKGTDKDTQEVINTIIGCDLGVFTSSVYAAQEMMPNLPGMTDKSLKQLIEASSGTERLAKAHDVAKLQLLAATKKLEIAEAVVKLSDHSVTQASDFLNDSKASFNDHDVAKAADVKMRSDSIKTAVADIQHARHLLGAEDEPKWLEREKSLKEEIDTHSNYGNELRRLQKIETNLGSEFTMASKRLIDLRSLLSIREDALKKLDSTVGSPCPSCGKAYCEEDLESVRVVREKEVNDTKDSIDAQIKTVEDCDEALKKAQKDVEDYSATIPDISALTQEYTEVVRKLAVINDMKTRIAAMLNAVKSSKETLDDIKNAANPFASQIEKWEKAIVEREQAADTARKELDVEVRNAEIAKSVVKVFGPAGVRARILDTVTPFLNARTSDYLGSLSDGNISAIWTTIQRTKSGELREKFGIDVTNDKGAKMFSGLSGGEKRKVRLACALALQDLVSSRATKPINLFIGDEIDDALDSAGLERLMGILEMKARERGTVLVISHENLSDWIDDVATVEKSGGVSTVTGVLSK